MVVEPSTGEYIDTERLFKQENFVPHHPTYFEALFRMMEEESRNIAKGMNNDRSGDVE